MRDSGVELFDSLDELDFDLLEAVRAALADHECSHLHGDN